MLLGGGYYGQRLNKIYRGPAKNPVLLRVLYSDILVARSRERDGARDPSHSSAYDQAVRTRKIRGRTVWRLCDPCRLYISYDGGKGVVRRHGWRRTISRDRRMSYLFAFTLVRLSSKFIACVITQFCLA